MEQKIVHGIENIIADLKDKKFLLVRDSAYDFLAIKSQFDKIPHIEFGDFTPNPLYEQVCEGVKLFNQNECEMIVAVGGGSAIDVAKCIKLYCKMDDSVNYLQQEKADTKIPLIAIPTTAGTGSESTRHAVIYFEGKKQSISHPSIVPNIAVLEPSSLKTLPLYQKKCTLMDALCQACESWWSVNRTDESISYSKKAITLISLNMQKYIEENDQKAAENIMLAANFAGKAINITATTAAHAMSYKITSLYGFPHGHAVAVCFAELWKEMQEELTSGKVENAELENIFKEISAQMGYKTVDEGIRGFSEMLKKLELSNPVSHDFENEIDVLTESVNPDRLKNNPIQFPNEIIKKMYKNIIKYN